MHLIWGVMLWGVQVWAISTRLPAIIHGHMSKRETAAKPGHGDSKGSNQGEDKTLEQVQSGPAQGMYTQH